jgi:CrcB protein
MPIVISIGAVIGALSRYYITLFWLKRQGQIFPYGTLFANLTGAFLIGLASMLATKYNIAVAIQKLILVGFLGAYTTFSTYILDSTILLRGNRNLRGLFYWLGSPILGFIAVELGIAIANNFN